MLTVLVCTISNSQLFLLKKVSSFCKCKSYSHFFSKNISVHAIFDDQRFNDKLTNYILSFKQLGPGDDEFSRLQMGRVFSSQQTELEFHVKYLLRKGIK